MKIWSYKNKNTHIKFYQITRGIESGITLYRHKGNRKSKTRKRNGPRE